MGPDIELRYSEHNGDLIRHAIGRRLERYDVHREDGWRDWRITDVERGQSYALSAPDSNGRTALAPAGVSRWQGMGPTIAANRNCLDCHRIKGARTVAGLTIGAKLGPVEAGIAARLVNHVPRDPIVVGPPRPPSAPVPAVPGPPGPIGPAGKPGADGKPGPGITQADIDRLIAQLDSRFTTRINGLDARITTLEAAPGTDVDAIVAEIIKRLPPIYVGAKDTSGNVTMPLAAVKLGEGIYIHVEPPALTTGK